MCRRPQASILTAAVAAVGSAGLARPVLVHAVNERPLTFCIGPVRSYISLMISLPLHGLGTLKITCKRIRCVSVRKLVFLVRSSPQSLSDFIESLGCFLPCPAAGAVETLSRQSHTFLVLVALSEPFASRRLLLPAPWLPQPLVSLNAPLPSGRLRVYSCCLACAPPYKLGVFSKFVRSKLAWRVQCTGCNV